MAWLHRHRLWVLVLDGTERWTAFPRLAVFPAADGWAACVIEAPGRRTWVPGSFSTDDAAKAAAIDAARHTLAAQWLPALTANRDLAAANDAGPTFAPFAKLGFTS